MKKKMSTEKIASMILKAKAAEIRDVPKRVTNEEVEKLPLENQPFLYASGNWGPGYITIKGCVGFTELFESTIGKLKEVLLKDRVKFDFVAGLMTGGVIPGFRLSQLFSVPFVCIHGTRRLKETLGTVVNGGFLEEVSAKLKEAVIKEEIDVDFVAGLAPRGMVPGHRLAQLLREELERDIPYVYIRSKRKKGGLKELITGATNSPNIHPEERGVVIGEPVEFGISALKEAGFEAIDGIALLNSSDIEEFRKIELPFTEVNRFIPLDSVGIVSEELVNFAQSTTNGALYLRATGFTVNHGATILNYGNPKGLEQLKETEMKLHCVMSLNKLLEVAEKKGFFKSSIIADYRNFLANPLKWQTKRGLEPVKEGGTR